MLPPGFTLEERARLSEDAAVRRHFDRRNLAVLRWASWFFAALAFSFLNRGLMRANPMTTAVAGAALVMSLLGAFALRRIFRPGAATRWLDRLGEKIGREARAFTIGYLVFQFAAPETRPRRRFRPHASGCLKTSRLARSAVRAWVGRVWPSF